MKFVELTVKAKGFEFSVSGNYQHGDPGVRYDKDGSGTPPEGPEIEYTSVQYKGIEVMELLDAVNDEFINDHFYDKVTEAMESNDDGDRGYDSMIDDRLERGEK